MGTQQENQYKNPGMSGTGKDDDFKKQGLDPGKKVSPETKDKDNKLGAKPAGEDDDKPQSE